MKIAIDISPVSSKGNSAHKVRGVGAYIDMLRKNLPQIDKKNNYSFVEDGNFNDANIVHFPFFDPFFITLPVQKKNKLVVTVHDLTPIIYPKKFPVGIKGKIRWQIQKRLLNRADAVIVDSMSSRDDVVRKCGINPDKVHVVYLGVPLFFKKLEKKEFSEVHKKYNLPDDFFLYVGDATPNKNLPFLINAIKKTDFKLVIVGRALASTSVENHPWNDDLSKVIRETTDNKQFIKLGFVPDEDLVKLYNLAKALILPSIYEGFGLPVLEAMSCGCPVITTRGGSLPEVGGEAVLYVDPYNDKALIDGLVKVNEDLHFVSELSEAGYKQSKKFSIKKSIMELIDVYEKINK